MAEAAVLSFGQLLRKLRAESKLTQEELAESAGLSPRTVSDLERGINSNARKDTAELLADALGLCGPVRVSFVAAARGRQPAEQVLEVRQNAADGAGAELVAIRAEQGPATGQQLVCAGRARRGEATTHALSRQERRGYSCRKSVARRPDDRVD